MHIEMNGGDIKDLLKAAESCRHEGVMLLKDGKWLLKTIGPDQALMFNTRVTKKAMESYDNGGAEKMGIKYKSILNSINSSNKDVRIEADLGSGAHKLKVTQGGFTAGLTLVNTDYVEGVGQGVPSVDWPVEVEGDVSFLRDFIDRADTIVGQDYFFVSPREEGLYLYTEKDNQDLVMRKEWDSFKTSIVDWDKGSPSDEADGNDLNPPEDKGTDAVFSLNWADAIRFIESEAKFRFGNHSPMHVVFNTDSGIDASYFLAPRFQIESESWALSNDKLGR